MLLLVVGAGRLARAHVARRVINHLPPASSDALPLLEARQAARAVGRLTRPRRLEREVAHEPVLVAVDEDEGVDARGMMRTSSARFVRTRGRVFGAADGVRRSAAIFSPTTRRFAIFFAPNEARTRSRGRASAMILADVR